MSRWNLSLLAGTMNQIGQKLIAAIVCSAGPLAAADLSDLQYLVSGGRVIITGSVLGASGTLVVPDTIDGYPVTQISGSAFAGRTGLTSVTLPSSITTMGDGVFRGCTGLVSVNIPGTIGVLPARTFYQCTNLKDVIYSPGISRIEQEAFEGCTGLEHAPIPDSVTSLGEGVFRNCGGLVSIAVPGSLKSLGVFTFEGCVALSQVEIPEGVESGGSRAFSGCTNLTSITLPSTVLEVSGFINEAPALAWVSVHPDNPTLRSIDGVVYSKDGETLVRCPQGRQAEHYVNPGTVTIGARSFQYCHLLSRVMLENSVTQIQDMAFFGCRSLDSMDLPSGVIGMGIQSFADCVALKSVRFSETFTTWGIMAFSGCVSLTTFTVDEGNPVYRSRDGVIYDPTGLRLIWVPTGRTGTFVIPDGVTGINSSAFMDCSGIVELIFPESITTLANTPQPFYRMRSLRRILFKGDAPPLHPTVWNYYLGVRSGVIIFYFSHKSGFTYAWASQPAGYRDFALMALGSHHQLRAWLMEKNLTVHMFGSPSLDHNGDGVGFLTAYALNLDPNENLAGSMPKMVWEEGRVSMRYHSATPEVTYRVETSTDMLHWSGDGVSYSAQDAEKKTTATFNTTGETRFMRLRMEY